ncbi:hypothetical protein GYMLUDRAFT_915270 [Collybiopsis luxurians FD-317 M1]|nr:hypothetical protein GYMLUDRAFT_915270 [Collybiopsis luxurians FD-317 M1]
MLYFWEQGSELLEIGNFTLIQTYVLSFLLVVDYAYLSCIINLNFYHNPLSI